MVEIEETSQIRVAGLAGVELVATDEDGDRLTTYGEKAGVGGINVAAFMEDSRGRLWVGTWGNGALVFENDGFRPVESVPLTENAVTSMAEVEDGTIWFGTGTGLAPYMSMLRTMLPDGGDRRVAVLLGARHSWDLGYQSELVTMDRLSPAFSYFSIISRPAEEPVPWGGPAGYVQDLWQGDHLERVWGARPEPDATRVFLCGNPSMIEEMVKILGGEGFREHSRT